MIKKLEYSILLSAILIGSASYGRGLIRANHNNQLIKDQDYKECFREACKTEYVSDGENDEDFWQTPKETRIRGAGDCEDMAFDLYDKLEKKHIESRVVIGRHKNYDHCWIEYDHNGNILIMDPSRRSICKKEGNNEYIESELEIDKRNIKDFIEFYITQERKIQSALRF